MAYPFFVQEDKGILIALAKLDMGQNLMQLLKLEISEGIVSLFLIHIYINFYIY